MTVFELFERGKALLSVAGINNFSNEARWIFEDVFSCSREYLIFHSNDEVNLTDASNFFGKINKRASGFPVQYVIGSWDFYDESFDVGEGVLIPRPETELLVDFALDYIKDIKNPVVFDLCAGSGCIGLSVAKNCPEAKVFLVEKSSEAYFYLEKNLKKIGCGNAKLICGDVFEGFQAFDLPKPDLILSNPPYIESDDIEGLQSEVHYEPTMALDGGKDGLIFYRAIAEKWLPFCKGGAAVECGEGQADSIKSMFSSAFAETYSMKDFNDIERVVIGKERI